MADPMIDAEIAELRAGLVKPLVWRDLSAPNDPEFLAHHCYGSYTIRHDASFTLPWIVKPFPCAGSNFSSMEEAQAAAEAEHKSRMVRELDPAALLARLDAAEGALTRMTNNRDMWKGQCERQADSLMKLRVSGIALLEAARLVSAYGAQTGSQWVNLSAAIPQMSAALSIAKAEG